MEQRNEKEVKGRLAARSVRGGRPSQQDTLFSELQPDGFQAIICDGMGGMEGGEEASHTAVEVFVEGWASKPEYESCPDFFRRISRAMDQAVFKLMQDGKPLGAGTTAVAAIARGRELFWMSIGDSRLYIKRGHEMLCPVKAHNYLEHLNGLLLSQRISEELYGQEIIKGDALTGYLGMGTVRQMEVNASPFLMEPGDQILLCSDGLYRSVADSRIKEILDMDAPAEWKASCLTALAVNAGGEGQDNTSVILYEEELL